MTEYELDKIKKSFVRSNAKCPVEVACLLTVIKYYNGKETDILTMDEKSKEYCDITQSRKERKKNYEWSK